MALQIGYLKLLITPSILSSPLDFEIKRVACTSIKANEPSQRNRIKYVGLQYTVNFLDIGTPKIFVVITLKFELCGSTIE